MCGIVSLVYESDNPALGRLGESLLMRLEYRGYDSTGAAFIDSSGEVKVRKAVGAPSKVCPALGIAEVSGQRFIGQVRWATQGAVTDFSSQPHYVYCRRNLVGAHNGSIANPDSLRAWLLSRGHALASDSDGEVLIHLIEEHYAANQSLGSADLASMRQAYAASGLGDGLPDGVLRMIDALRKADVLAGGDYSAAVADPALPGVFAVNAGSSLYAGSGYDEAGSFIIISSDLTCVLSKTRALIPLSDGEGLWITHLGYLVFTVRKALSFSKPSLRRSKLSIQETQLDANYAHFMEQEIMAGPAVMERLSRYYLLSKDDEKISSILEEKKDFCIGSANFFSTIAEKHSPEEMLNGLDTFFISDSWKSIKSHIEKSGYIVKKEINFLSDESELLSTLAVSNKRLNYDLFILDLIFIWIKRRSILHYYAQFRSAILEADRAGGRVYLIASGSSYHAALTSSYFFNSMAHIPVYPCNPGIFRSMYMESLGEADLLVGISQSGETKDLVDVFVEIKERHPKIKRASIVNNENARIPKELCDFYLPLLCGPEIAVVATKSFISQVAVLYLLAAGLSAADVDLAKKLKAAGKIMTDSLTLSAKDVEKTAARLFTKPSIQLLGTNLLGLAKEGALKIREVALNHTEGGEAAEFKHGSNSILGKNTILSLSDLEPFLNAYRNLAKQHPAVEGTRTRDLLKNNPDLIEGLRSGYPLIFLCAPDERDVRVTISQIQLHKIRGADVVLFAERRQDLAMATAGRPAGFKQYWSSYIEVSATGDPCLFVFGAAILLQYLAYRISVLKMDWLNALGFAEHGVHPDVPKNVSKSITIE